jgi:hypothetical protein
VMIGMGLFWLALIIGVVWFVRDAVEHRQQVPETALQILDRLLAEGAISVDEYKERRDVLTDVAAPPRTARASTVTWEHPSGDMTRTQSCGREAGQSRRTASDP